MTTNDLLTLMDREAQTLTDENNHSAAAIMREAAEHLRRRAVRDLIDGPATPLPFKVDTSAEEMFRRQNAGR